MSDKTNQLDETAEQDLSELLQIRRDKLSALQQEGKDPFLLQLAHVIPLHRKSVTALKNLKIRMSVLLAV